MNEFFSIIYSFVFDYNISKEKYIKLFVWLCGIAIKFKLLKPIAFSCLSDFDKFTDDKLQDYFYLLNI
jgi:hypothetical protein